MQPAPSKRKKFETKEGTNNKSLITITVAIKKKKKKKNKNKNKNNNKKKKKKKMKKKRKKLSHHNLQNLTKRIFFLPQNATPLLTDREGERNSTARRRPEVQARRRTRNTFNNINTFFFSYTTWAATLTNLISSQSPVSISLPRFSASVPSSNTNG